MAGLALNQEDLQQAMLCASVSASYFIEQYGMARLSVASPNDEGQCENGRTERWNDPGSQPEERLQQLVKRLQQDQ